MHASFKIGLQTVYKLRIMLELNHIVSLYIITKINKYHIITL